MNRKYEFHKLRTNNANIPSSVTCMVKDKKGFIWFGTLHGLYRFDGLNLKVYTHKIDDKNSISQNDILCMCDDDNYLWIGTWGGGLNRFDKKTEQFRAYKFDPSDNSSIERDMVFDIYIMKSGEMLVGTRKGLNKFDKKNERFSIYEDAPIKLVSDAIAPFYEDKEGYLWIGTFGNGLFRYDQKSDAFKEFRPDSNSSISFSSECVNGIVEDNDANIWIATWGGGVYKLDKKKEIFYQFQHDSSNKNSLIGNIVTSISIDEDQTLWFGSPEGISIFNPYENDFTHLKNNDDLSSLTDITVIYSDNLGIVWVCTLWNGISIYNKNKRRFSHFKRIESDNKSLTSKSAFSICDDENGNIWIASDNGIDILNKNKERIRHIENNIGDPKSLSNNNIWCVYRDKKSDMWVVTYDNALERYESETGEFSHFYDFDGKGFLCHSIYEDKKENLWLALYHGGVRVFDKTRKLTKKYLTTEIGNLEYIQIKVRKVLEDETGNVWMATNKGLGMLDKKTDSIVFYKNIPEDINSINSDDVLSIVQDKKDNIWIGTKYGGLNRFNPETKTFKNYIKEKESVFNTVYNLLLDEDENIWLTTEKSIAKFNPKNESFTNYDERDGIRGLGFIINSYFKSGDGEIFFGCNYGFISFYPNSIRKNEDIPNIVLTDFRIFNKEVKLDTSITEIREITISYKENFFSFDFASLDYTNPEKNQHAYMLEGVDKDWNYVGNVRTANYTDIKPGEYVFRVKGSNNDGVWNEEGAFVKLIITPPWYKTIWFKGLTTLSVIGGIGLMFNQRFEKIRKEKKVQEDFSRKLIETQENEKKRVASELHDSLGQNLLIIKNKALISIKKTDDVEKFRAQMNEISDLTTSTINEVREISYDLRPYELDRLGLIKTLQSLVDRASKSTNIKFICDIDNIDKVFTPEIEINIYRIIQECLSNIIKHSEATEVIVHLKKFEKEISIFISDNGKGFDIVKQFSDSKRKGFGLRGIPERVKLFGGDFKIESEPGKGTRIKIIIPI